MSCSCVFLTARLPPSACRCRALFFNTGRVQSSSLPEKMALPADERGDTVCETKGNVRAIHGLYLAGEHSVYVHICARAAPRPLASCSWCMIPA
jgi:hypothetical protein